MRSLSISGSRMLVMGMPSGVPGEFHHPDGGFRRFVVLKDGGGVAAADGAAVAQQNLAGGLLEVSVDGDRYRFPVTAKSDAPAK